MGRKGQILISVLQTTRDHSDLRTQETQNKKTSNNADAAVTQIMTDP